jgi:hypothetical protein
MGVWSTLGKIAGIAGPIAAAPFTGGASLLTTLGMGAKTAGLLGAGLGAAGKLASGASAQRASDRASQADYDVIRAQLENNRITNANTQAMQRGRDVRDAEAARYRQIGSADMLGSSKPPTDPRAILSGAGFMSPETLQMIRGRAMSALESGGDVPQLQQTAALPATLPKGTGMDSFLNALSMGGTALGALGEAGVLGRGGAQMPIVDPRENAANEERIRQIYGGVRFG